MRKLIDSFEEIVCVACLAVMLLLTFANVIARYIFSASFSFSEEITTYLFVLLSLLGASVAAKRGAHLGFTLLTEIVSPPIRKVMGVISMAFAVLFCATLCYHGILMTISQYQRNQVTAGMQWPEWIFGSFVPIGAFFVAFRFSQLLIKQIRKEA